MFPHASMLGPARALILLLPLSAAAALAALLNSTVDDTLPDPRTGDRILYTPDSAWVAGSSSCDRCVAHPAAQSVYRETWHEGMSGGSNGSLVASMAFTGTAIYVYCVVPQTTANPNGYTDLTFTVDNQPAGSFQRTPSGGDGYDYDVLVFSSTSLTNTRHHFFLSSGTKDGPSSTVILDRIVYSYDDGKNTSSTGAIAGIVVGSLAGVALLGTAAFWYFFRYRRTRHKKTSSQHPVLIDPELDADGEPIEYPTVEPYTQTHPRQTARSGSDHSRLRSPESPTTPTSPTSSRVAVKSRPRVPLQKPSQASISLSLPYSANDVDIYDPYGRLSISFSGTGTATSATLPVTATSTIYAAASTSSGASGTVGGSDNQPPPAYELMPLVPRKGKGDKDRKEKRRSTEKH